MLLTGCSAGGLATYLHADHVGAHLRKAAPALRRFKAAPDAGFFLMQPNAEGLPVYPDQMREIFRLSNASGGVNAACIAAQKEGEEFRCNFAENNYPHLFSTFDTDGLDTGIFVINSALDSYQTSCILQAEPVIPGGTHTGFGNGNCSSSPSFSAGCRGKELEHACNASDFRLLAGYERKFLETVHGAGSYTADVRLPRVLACASSSFATPLCAAGQGNGAFTYSCHTHCAGSGQGFADIKMADHQGNRVTMREAVGRWWRAPATTKAEVNNYQPCIWSGPDEKPCCVAPPP